MVQHGLIPGEFRIARIEGLQLSDLLVDFGCGGQEVFLPGGQVVLLPGELLYLCLEPLPFFRGFLRRDFLQQTLSGLDFHGDILRPVGQGSGPEGELIFFGQESSAPAGLPCHEAAQNLGRAVQGRPGVAQGQVPVLEIVKGRGISQCLALFRKLLPTGRSPAVLLDIFLRVGKGVQHIVRRHLLQSPPVIHGASRGLLIELEQHPAQSGLAAAGFPHQAESLPLVDVH